MAQFLSQRFATLKTRAARLILGGLLLALVTLLAWWLVTARTPQPALCQTPCLCRYCDEPTINGRCPTTGDGGCIGCAGACTSPGNCSEAGGGGCGPVGCGCRGSDCQGAPPPPSNPPTPIVVTPEPTPPPDCPPPGEVREWINLIPPKLAFAGFKPDHPVVVEQDPDKQGFQMHITGTGGRYEHKTQRLEKVCDDQPEPINGTPQPCREWHYECPIRCAECYNDPFAGIQVRMRLADSTMAWIQGELASRYTGAEPKEGLPRTWQLPGVYGQMSVDQWWIYAPGKPDILSNGPLDPGIHGGVIAGWTTGTPKSALQVVERAFAVPVFLMDTTIAK
jgi:hypothetical protein